VTDPDGAAKFIAVVSRDGERGFRAIFPDLPGRSAFGATFEDASSAAAEALALILEEIEGAGRALPAPSSFTAVLSNPRYRDGIAIRVTAARRARMVS
jgi:predicted RNase H-like HicB family nuclease